EEAMSSAVAMHTATARSQRTRNT
ncbi:MAG: hypothetical protein QOK33_3652, partial [Mycobacterium sp.]|nr:hypothetical protein [Mycobacterium sp.]